MKPEDKSRLVQLLLRNDIEGITQFKDRKFVYPELINVMTQAMAVSKQTNILIEDETIEALMEIAKSNPSEDRSFFIHCLGNYKKDVNNRVYLIGAKVAASRLGVNNIDYSRINDFIIWCGDKKEYALFNSLLDIGLDVYRRDGDRSLIYVIFIRWSLGGIMWLDEKININYNFSEGMNRSGLLGLWLERELDEYTKRIGMLYFVRRGASLQKAMVGFPLKLLDLDGDNSNYTPSALRVLHFAQYLGFSIKDDSIIADKLHWVEIFRQEYQETLDDDNLAGLKAELEEYLIYTELIRHYSVPSLKGLILGQLRLASGDLSIHPDVYVKMELDYPMLNLDLIKTLVDQKVVEMTQ